MKRNSVVIAAHLIAVILMLLLIQGCQSVDSTASTKEPDSSTKRTATATSETAITTSEDPTNYEPSETGNTTVSESTHESTEPNTEETTEAGATEPKPTEPKPTEPKPTEPKPTEPKPTEPKPTEPKPTEPKPTEPKPTEPKPTEPKPTEPKPTEPTPTNPPHTHSWSGWTQTTAPTCTAAGVETRTCSCGATETRPVNPLGHTWQETAPTCTEAGSKTCKVCGKQESGAPATGHDWVHHEAVGHYQWVYTCYCGTRFYDYDEWYAHSEENWDNGTCGGFEAHQEWIVDENAYDECSICHATR